MPFQPQAQERIEQFFKAVEPIQHAYGHGSFGYVAVRQANQIDVPNPAVVQCVANCAGIAQHFSWLLDPSAAQNSRRAVYEGFDENLTRLKDIFQNAGMRGTNARDFESVIAWLLWMLGFSVAHLGGIPTTQDAADLICVTPGGHIAVIECTTGLLKSDNKLSLLCGRAQIVRRSLENSNNRHVRILPIIITSKTREEIKADLEQAEKLGVLVVAREELDQAINRTTIPPNAEQMYQEAERSVQASQARYQTQPALPLSITA